MLVVFCTPSSFWLEEARGSSGETSRKTFLVTGELRYNLTTTQFGLRKTYSTVCVIFGNLALKAVIIIIVSIRHTQVGQRSKVLLIIQSAKYWMGNIITVDCASTRPCWRKWNVRDGKHSSNGLIWMKSQTLTLMLLFVSLLSCVVDVEHFTVYKSIFSLPAFKSMRELCERLWSEVSYPMLIFLIQCIYCCVSFHLPVKATENFTWQASVACCHICFFLAFFLRMTGLSAYVM